MEIYLLFVESWLRGKHTEPSFCVNIYISS